jgi:hypothetical protein
MTGQQTGKLKEASGSQSFRKIFSAWFLMNGILSWFLFGKV